MPALKFNNKRVLIVPLDWGLGHATRCIPLIRALLQRECEVIIGADGAAATLLKQEFPQLHFLRIGGYNVQYSNAGWALPLRMAVQIPKIFAAIKREHQWLDRVIDQYRIDLVISDNRFGLYTSKVPCVFITHQLQIKAPIRWMEQRLRNLNFKYISRFTECWVPDSEQDALAGSLSHLDELHPFPIRYIGPLSRFKRQMAVIRYKFLFMISGPEPQRSLLEAKILRDIHRVEEDVLIVRGKPGDTTRFDLPAHITVANHLDGAALEKAMNGAEYIIARSGYTTIMEIAALQKRAVLIPTPGQTEQEYLAAYLQQQHLVLSVPQDQFDLKPILAKAQQFNYQPFSHTPAMLEKQLDDFFDRWFQPLEQPSFAAP